MVYIPKSRTEYAYYIGDKFITIGTLKELAKELHVKKETLHFYTTPAYKRRRQYSNKSIVMVKL